MNRMTILLFLLLNLACTTSNQSPSNVSFSDKSNSIETSKTTAEPYQLEIEIEQTADGVNYLIANIKPDKGSWFTSPNSKYVFKGEFKMTIEENDKLSTDDTMTETPLSVEETLPFGNEVANVVRKKTTYKRKLNITAQEDFKVSGMIQFVIEPRCTLEQIAFTISNRSGKMEADFVSEK